MWKRLGRSLAHISGEHVEVIRVGQLEKLATGMSLNARRYATNSLSLQSTTNQSSLEGERSNVEIVSDARSTKSSHHESV
jgi:hypothetical protein